MSYPRIFSTPGVGPLAEEVDRERLAQLAKWGDQQHPDGTGDPSYTEMAHLVRQACQEAAGRDAVTWRHILAEEVWEALAEEPGSEGLRAELVQCASVIFAWVYDIDRRRQAAYEARKAAGK